MGSERRLLLDDGGVWSAMPRRRQQLARRRRTAILRTARVRCRRRRHSCTAECRHATRSARTLSGRLNKSCPASGIRITRCRGSSKIQVRGAKHSGAFCCDRTAVAGLSVTTTSSWEIQLMILDISAATATVGSGEGWRRFLAAVAESGCPFGPLANSGEDAPVKEDHDDGGDVEGAHRRVDEEVGVEERALERPLLAPLRLVHAQRNGCRYGNRHHPRHCQGKVHAVRVLVFSVLYWLGYGYKPANGAHAISGEWCDMSHEYVILLAYQNSISVAYLEVKSDVRKITWVLISRTSTGAAFL